MSIPCRSAKRTTADSPPPVPPKQRPPAATTPPTPPALPVRSWSAQFSNSMQVALVTSPLSKQERSLKKRPGSAGSTAGPLKKPAAWATDASSSEKSPGATAASSSKKSTGPFKKPAARAASPEKLKPAAAQQLSEKPAESEQGKACASAPLSHRHCRLSAKQTRPAVRLPPTRRPSRLSPRPAAQRNARLELPRACPWRCRTVFCTVARAVALVRAARTAVGSFVATFASSLQGRA